MMRNVATSSLLLVSLLAGSEAPAKEDDNAAATVSGKRWTLGVGLGDARHPSWQFPLDVQQPESVRYGSQTVTAPREVWGLDLRVSLRLPRAAGRLEGRAFVENLGDQLFTGTQGVAVPYELPDGQSGTIHMDASPRIEPRSSYSLTWSKDFYSRGSVSLGHELGFVSHRLNYGYFIPNGVAISRSNVRGLRLGVSGTKMLAQGAALDLILGCTLGRSNEEVLASTIEIRAEEDGNDVTVTDTIDAFRGLPDATVRLRIPLSGRVEAALGYHWESLGRTRLGRASTSGAFVNFKLGVGR